MVDWRGWPLTLNGALFAVSLVSLVATLVLRDAEERERNVNRWVTWQPWAECTRTCAGMGTKVTQK